MESLTLETHDLSLGFAGNDPIVRNVNLRVFRGEIVGVSGPSGSGKSLTLWSLLGLLPQSAVQSGSFTLYNAAGDKFDIRSASDAQRIRGKLVVMIPQNPFTSLNPVLKCGVQIGEVVCKEMASKSDLKTHVIRHLAQFGFEDPERIYASYPFELSGGQLQRVVVAMATVAEPALVLADEPTTALDVRTQEAVLQVLGAWVKKTGKSMLLVSHDSRMLRQHCDRIYSLTEGTLHEDQLGSSDSVVNPYKGADNQQDTDETVCSLKGVSLRYRSRSGMHVDALTDISFELYREEILGIIGSTGSGKSSIARVLSGLVTPHAGTVTCLGSDLDYHRYPELRRSVQMVFQDPYSALYPHWTAGAYLKEALRLHRISTRDYEDELIHLVLTDVGLSPELADRYPHQLSGGERQRMQIARAILMRPRILICDEITSGLDKPIQDQILALLQRLNQTYAISIVLISHDLEVIRRLADRVLILDEGRIVDIGPTSRVFGDRAHFLTRHS